MGTGSLHGVESDGLDEHGLAISIYFRILKSSICFFILLGIVTLPLLFLLSGGAVHEDASSAIDQKLSVFSIGNLGEEQALCRKANIKIYDSVQLSCPGGAPIAALLRYGLQKPGARHREDICPLAGGGANLD